MKASKVFLVILFSLCSIYLSAQKLVKDINPGYASGLDYYAKPFCNSNGFFFFEGYTIASGGELWKSDGTAEGTQMVKDIAPGNKTSFVNYLTDVNGTLFFRAGNDGNNFPFELWKSDGTEEGTVMVKALSQGEFGSADPKNLFAFQGILYFSANDNINGVELWKSDGTEEGTVIVKDIKPGFLYSAPEQMTSFNNELFFISEGQLWKTDGTEAGTILVISNSVELFYIDKLIVVNSILYFTGSNSVNGNELWKTDGTEEGTQLVSDIANGTGGSHPFKLINVNGQLFFFANDGVHGIELWKTDGQITRLVKDIKVGSENGYVNYAPDDYTACAVGNYLYFRADEGINGVELWKSDGTEEGTRLVKDIFPGEINPNSKNSSMPNALFNFNGQLYFQARDSAHYIELWESDGTSDGTLVKDISPNGSSAPYAFHTYKNSLYFSATGDREKGTELWSYSGSLSVIQKNKLSPPSIYAYPNPVNEWITVKASSELLGLPYQLIDSQGRTILTDKLKFETININLTDFPAGIYFIKVGEQNQQSFKVVKY